jgi:hypothetical protein
MRPPAGVLLHQAHRAGGARALLERPLYAESHHFLVRAADRQMQEPQAVEERLGRVPEGVDDHLLRDLCGARAIGVASHAIDDDEQRRVLGNGRADPVLVLFAPAQQADVGTFDAQEQIHASDRLSHTLYHLCGRRA